jgi:hypothetical protein
LDARESQRFRSPAWPAKSGTEPVRLAVPFPPLFRFLEAERIVKVLRIWTYPE